MCPNDWIGPCYCVTVPVESYELRALVGFEDAWAHFNALTLSAH